MTTVAIALSGFQGDRTPLLWQQTCTGLQSELKSPYLQMTFAFLVASSGNKQVTNETAYNKYKQILFNKVNHFLLKSLLICIPDTLCPRPSPFIRCVYPVIMLIFDADILNSVYIHTQHTLFGLTYPVLMLIFNRRGSHIREKLWILAKMKCIRILKFDIIHSLESLEIFLGNPVLGIPIYS